MTAGALLAVLSTLAVSPTPSFPKVEGWKVDGLATYTPENLYEYIDGAADAFLQLDFEELKAATYSNAARVEVTVDVYRHRDATCAFGMYAQERPSAYTPLPIGTEGYSGADHFEFVAGPYYVKMTQSKGGATQLRAIAERVAATLPGSREPPRVLRCFPAKGKRLRGERLAMKEFLGHAFLHGGFTAPYELDGVRFRLFAIEGRDAADAHEMVRRYLALAKSGATARDEGQVALADPLNGKVLVAWKGRWIWGAIDGAPSSRLELVEALGACVGATQR